MKPFSKLLRPLTLPLPTLPWVASPRRGVSASPGKIARVQATIQHALETAGLDARTGSAPDLHTMIQSAIQSALGQANPLDAGGKPQARPTATRAPRAGRASVAGSIDASSGGTSTEVTFTCDAGTRSYTLYVPRTCEVTDSDAPLLLMLHGCTQSPADFAAGTRMNAFADTHGVLVAYPAQTARDNGSRCWNWFRREDQQRGSGEPAILAGIVHDIASRQRVDTRRVYVAGLSAGAAMAVILGRTYPDVFAAVGAHSGLPFGAAHDVPGAFAAMQGNGSARPPAVSGDTGRRRTPTIVFHGTADHTVQARNGDAIVADVVAGDAASPRLQASASDTNRINGRDTTRTCFADDAGHVLVTQWLIAGAGHAWSGGDPAGSYTDPQGPDASDELLRFCLRHTL